MKSPILQLVLLKIILSSTTSTAIENPQDHYCGLSWPDAFDNCPKPCPSQDDSDCISLGANFKCYGYTGCRDKVGDGEDASGGQESSNGNLVESGEEGEDGEDVVEANKYCGATW
jgi:hypothetical protein